MGLRSIAALYLLSLVALCGQATRADRVNFYNIQPPVQATPFPKSFKCFTCERARDNYNCNIWAEDKWCAEDTEYCMSVHHFHSTHGQTKFVTKRCAGLRECQQSGCRHYQETGHTECVSCCEGMICNVEVPSNHTDAVFSLRQAALGSAPHRAPRPWGAVVLALGLCGGFLM